MLLSQKSVGSRSGERCEGLQSKNRLSENRSAINKSDLGIAAILGVVSVVTHYKQMPFGNGCTEGFGFGIVMILCEQFIYSGDFIGVDICLAIMDVLYNETGDNKYRACPLLRKMVRGGNLGVKSGKGFYVYNADRTKTPVDAQ